MQSFTAGLQDLARDDSSGGEDQIRSKQSRDLPEIKDLQRECARLQRNIEVNDASNKDDGNNADSCSCSDLIANTKSSRSRA